MKKLRVGIIIPLRAPESTSNWPVVAENCKRTLRSIFQNTSSNYQVVLACHQPPDGLKPDHRLKVVEMQLPIPSDLEGFRRDRYKKNIEAARILRQIKVDYMMRVDADDLIHRELIEWVVNKPLCSGYRVHKGWAYRGGFFARKVNNFDAMCGSSIIHRDIPHQSGIEPLTMGHCWARGYYHAIRKPLTDIPFRAACKVVGYGDSITEYKRRSLRRNMILLVKHVLHSRPIGPEFLESFGIESKWMNPL